MSLAGERRERPPTIRRDALDAQDFEVTLDRSRALSALAERGARVLPDFRELLGDLFSACVKLAVEPVPAAALPPSARVRARLVASVIESAAYARLHEVSRLQPARAGLAALRLGETVLKELEAGRLLLPRELRDTWEAEQREAAIEALREEAESARAIAEARGEGDPVGGVAAVEARILDEEAATHEAELEALGEALDRAAEGIGAETLQRVQGTLDRLGDATEALAAGEAQLGAEGEAGAGGDSVDALELGERLTRSRLLQRLARLVGALRREARAARRKRVPRARSEVYGVRLGSDLAHLLPSELVTLRHPTLRREFRRRWVEGRLLSYQVRGEDHEGRGPAVICLDVSGSMAGRKAIWAKAMALTLADLARRDGRAVTVLTFSSGRDHVRRHDLVPDRRSATGRQRLAREPLLSFVEATVGGGTDFAAPLARAADLIRTSRRHRRGDVVLITDGEAPLSADQLAAFEAFKAETDSRCLGVVVDVAGHRTDTLERVTDQLVSVNDLTAGDARRIFAAFDGRGR